MDLGSQRIKRISITDEVVKRLQDQITSGMYAVGEKLPTELELQKTLGVGRSTIREALRVLQALGLAEMKSGLGAFIKNVHEPSTAEVEHWMVENEERLVELMEVRSSLEAQAVELAIKRGSQEDIDRIATVHQAFVKACRERNASKLAKLDEEFHSAIFKASNNVYLIRLGKIIAGSLRDYRAHSFSHEKFANNALKPHGEILDAITHKNAKKALTAMRKHLSVSLHDLEYARQSGKAMNN